MKKGQIFWLKSKWLPYIQILNPTCSGHHVCLLFTQYAPYNLKDGVWDDQAKEDYANIVFDSIEQYAPGFK